jgi:uncharacterized SAM-binding protein YcdF (DUF218 family)
MSTELLALAKTWILPPGSLLLLLLLGLLLWRRPLGRLLVLAATLALYLLSMPLTTAWLAAGLETDPPADSATLEARGAQAILVLLAGRNHKAPELGGRDGLSPLSLQRLQYGVSLHRETGLPLAVSGGSVLPHEREALAVIAQRGLERDYGIQPLVVEGHSRNTRENLQFSRPLLAAAGIHKVVLVTHAWHLPRALLSAEQAGLAVIPAGTGFLSDGDDRTSWGDWMPSASALAVNRHLLHEHLGLLWYRWR